MLLVPTTSAERDDDYNFSFLPPSNAAVWFVCPESLPPPPPPLPMVELFVRWKFGLLIFKAREGGKEGRKEEYGATVRFLWGSHSFLSPADSAVFSLFSRYVSKIANCPPAPPPSRRETNR